MAVTEVPWGMLAEVQGWAPGGGFVRSEHRKSAEVTRGDLMRHNGGWVVVIAVGTATTRDAAGKVLDVSPVVQWQDTDGTVGSEVLWSGSYSGMGARTDTRILPDSIPLKLADAA